MPLGPGPFIRMFDDKFTIDDVRQAVVELEIVGADNYRLGRPVHHGEISRDPLELVKQTISEHQYPDGFGPVSGDPVRAHPGPRRQRFRLHPQGRRCGAISTPKLGCWKTG